VRIDRDCQGLVDTAVGESERPRFFGQKHAVECEDFEIAVLEPLGLREEDSGGQ
jgi:hypothetical protein